MSEKRNTKIRDAVFAGTWYPSEKEELIAVLETCLKKVKAEKKGAFPKGIISPHAGYVYSGIGNAYSYFQLKEYKTQIKRVIVLATPHRYPVKGISVNNVDYYNTPLGNVPVDTSITQKLIDLDNDNISYIPQAHSREHSLEIQLPFLKYILDDFDLIPILVGELSDEAIDDIGNVLMKYIDENTIVVASSDFTHYGVNYGYVPFEDNIKNNLTTLDLTAVNFIKQNDINGFRNFKKKTGITICGANPITILMKLMDTLGYKGELLNYYTSGDVTNDWSNSVSYVSLNYFKKDSKQTMRDINDEEKKQLITLAETTLTRYVKTGKIPELKDFDFEISDRLKKNQGAFVTLTKNGRLRGCIGYIEGIKPLWQTIIENTINACSKDYRFTPVKENELPDIELEISVMSPLFPIKPDEVVVGQHGLYLIKGTYRGVLLPQVPVEWGWDRIEYLQHLSNKAGLPKDTWKEPDVKLLAFTAQVFHRE